MTLVDNHRTISVNAAKQLFMIYDTSYNGYMLFKINENLDFDDPNRLFDIETIDDFIDIHQYYRINLDEISIN